MDEKKSHCHNTSACSCFQDFSYSHHQNFSLTRIDEIRINYQTDPVGIEKIENIGWKISSKEKSVFQKTYEIELAEDPVFKKVLYATGRVQSCNSTHIRLKKINMVLSSSRKYYIRVKIDTTAGESRWKTGTFVTALMQKEDWKAFFITIEKEEDRGESRSTCLRKEIFLKGKVKAAYAYTTALGLYHFYINGEKIGEDELTPGWTSYHKHLLYQVYDVTAQLHEGANAIAGMIGAGWYKGDMSVARARNHYGTRTAFLCQLVIEYLTGETEIICSDRTWKGSYGPILFSEIYDGEVYDARLEENGWNKFGFDDSRWKMVDKIDIDRKIMEAQSGSKVRQITRLPAKKVLVTPEGDTVLDFGQNMSGWIEFKVKGKPGDRVELNCFETLDAKGNVYLENLRSAKETIVYICRDENETVFHEHFSFQGFQYAKVASYPGKIRLENFTAYAVHSEMEPTGEFECSNQDINQLHHNIVWGMKSNFVDVPTDCPQRDERLGWTGDTQIFCRAASYLMNTYVFYRKWLTDVAADQTAEGGIPHVIPDVLNGKTAADGTIRYDEHSAAAWADVAVILPWTLYQMYGDTIIIEKQYESMKKWIGFMQEHAVDHIWDYGRQLGDWVALDAEEGSYFGATPNELICTAYYAYSVRLFSKMADAIGSKDDAREYDVLYRKIKKKYQERYFEAGRLKAQTQTAQIISLYFDLVPDEYRENVVEDLLSLLKKENGHLVTGFIGTPYFCHALSENGHTKEAYELLLKEDFPSWLYQVKQGATTVWEHWDGKKADGTMWSADMNSFNHYAYGAVADWFYRVIAGIELKETHPGFREFLIEPHVGGNLRYAKCNYYSIYGKIRSEWEFMGENIMLTVEIPCNTKATVIPYGASEILETGGLLFERKKGKLQANAGSGVYRIIYKI